MGSPTQCQPGGGTPIMCTVNAYQAWDDLCGVLQVGWGPA
jgi:hypothetical protein